MYWKNAFRLATALAIVSSVAISAQSPINIRLATLAPDNSPWSKALRSMGAAWENATDKRVKLTVYAGSIPSESSAIARMAPRMLFVLLRKKPVERIRLSSVAGEEFA